MSAAPLSPRQLFHLLDSGRITREEFRAKMNECAVEIIEEMEEDRLNPVAALMEQMLSRRAASKLMKHHQEAHVREVLQALSEVEDFSPARWLWNAAHPHIPLHAFFRSQRKPVFRVVGLDSLPQLVTVTVEYGTPGMDGVVREQIRLRRDRRGKLGLERRQFVPD
ncbi:hypothetical protein [Brevifollis gellanilyticus]|uniref:Uncharacterized protein n=1 Tax=Brevifollis gellanilyticus TaxID=748831 RepID=A0A512MGH5_9BACT|nr:hypothetical protein [Brevifollis gellanilyticus]GEP45829.1 hypothetical protein BGE01nite_51200 [Brevifollis gellanilyticus]